ADLHRAHRPRAGAGGRRQSHGQAQRRGMRRMPTLALAAIILAPLACGSSGPAVREPTADETANAGRDAGVDARPPAKPKPPGEPVVAPPQTTHGAAIFAGRVLAAAGGEVFCAQGYYNSLDKIQVTSVELESCNQAEDDVAVFYTATGRPTRAEAIKTLDDYLKPCGLEAPAILPMVRWPSAATKVYVPDWDLEIARDGARVVLTKRGESAPRWELTVPADRKIDSVHVLADTVAVVRSTGTTQNGTGDEVGRPVSDCHRSDRQR
ncbi:MAG: hypothetical protein KJO07_23740, partial [Deltaproteobacteria bacterium]|nr:hypothetical protein [Deltaproteobacteria bacterium]